MFSNEEVAVLKNFEKSAEETELYYVDNFEILKGFLPECETAQKVIDFYKTIKPCTCGNAKPVMIEENIMGDTGTTIRCEVCGRRIERSMYDYDIRNAMKCAVQCIKDWNDGKSQEDIERKLDKEHNRVTLTVDDVEWLPLYPNNMPGNGKEGEYALLFRKGNDGKIYGCKWSIVFQKEETKPMCTNFDADIECYNLFMKRYSDVKGLLHHPEPNDNLEVYIKADKEKTFDANEVNDFGDFVRSYKTIEDAKTGAMARCGWQGLNRDTLLKNT